MLRTGIGLIILALLVVPFTWALWGSGYNPRAGLIWSLENQMELVFSEERYEEVPVAAGERETTDVDTTQLSPGNRRLLRKFGEWSQSERVLVSPERSVPLRHVVALALLLLGIGVYCCVSALIVGRRRAAAR